MTTTFVSALSWPLRDEPRPGTQSSLVGFCAPSNLVQAFILRPSVGFAPSSRPQFRRWSHTGPSAFFTVTRHSIPYFRWFCQGGVLGFFVVPNVTPPHPQSFGGLRPPHPRVAQAPNTGKRQNLTHLAGLILLSPQKPRPAFAGARGAPPPETLGGLCPDKTAALGAFADGLD